MIVPTMTYGLFFDTTTSSGNTFSVSTLQTNIETEFKTPIIRNITPDEKVSFSFSLFNTGELQTINSISLSKINNPKFGSFIQTDVYLDETKLIYSGTLDKLDIPKYLVQNQKDSNKISFIFTISKEDYESTYSESVKFIIKNHAWSSDLLDGQGFYDDEFIDTALINPYTKPTTISLPFQSVNDNSSILFNIYKEEFKDV